jgi:NDP-sugar pyrophosphorylase family protein
MMNFLVDFEKKLGMKITCSQETEPMGTAGPLALARDKLDDGSGEAFFVLNSDVISEYPLKEMIKFHRNHGGEATIMVTKVSLLSVATVILFHNIHTHSCVSFLLCQDLSVNTISPLKRMVLLNFLLLLQMSCLPHR